MRVWRSSLAPMSVLLCAFLLGACSSGPGSSTTTTIPRVGLMHVGTDHVPPSLDTLVARLVELGWIDGPQDELMAKLTHSGRARSPRIELLWRNLEPGEVERQAAKFVRERVDVIVAFEDKSIVAAQAATAGAEDRIPVVFLHPSDPVQSGLVESLAHPGGNLTGVFGARDPVVKQLELYQQIMPGLKRLLTLVDPTDPSTPTLLAQARDAARSSGSSWTFVKRPRKRISSVSFTRWPVERSKASSSFRRAFGSITRRGRSNLRQKPTCRCRPTARNGSKRGHSSRWAST